MKSRGNEIFDYVAMGGGSGSVVGGVTGYVISQFVLNGKTVCPSVVATVINGYLDFSVSSVCSSLSIANGAKVVADLDVFNTTVHATKAMVESGLMQSCYDALSVSKIAPAAYLGGWALGIIAGAAYGYYATMAPVTNKKADIVVVNNAMSQVEPKAKEEANQLASVTSSATTLFSEPARLRKSDKQRAAEMASYKTLSRTQSNIHSPA
tara:strand:+ start:616 stop:1242 length:627 start_codon:yes stop_codon:yes gene_type:complete